MTHQEALKAADQLLDLCTPDKMSSTEALEFLSTVLDHLQSNYEALEEEYDAETEASR